MEQIETFTRAAGSAEANEDTIAVGPGVGVVVDGAGLPKDQRAGCQHSVQWYSRELASRMRGLLANREVEMTAALATALRQVADRHEECDLAAGSPSATVAAFRITGDRLEYLVLCDASIILRLADGRTLEVTDDRLGTLVGPAEGGLTSPDEIRAARAAVMGRARNRPGGFWCCQHDPEAARQALTGSHPLAELSGVIAASDGATRGHQSLGVLDLAGLASLVLEGSAGEVHRLTREAERAAAAKLRSRAIKQHDDFSLAWLRL
ncbi:MULTISPECIES: protein phosphatase 2C domain-containing protein [unclassified Luteococcus]|uniref:protein phosphatase 2C domain-containing protein n=1 Tax=unclassified Luteococcus TaxID=2639923 RepID=UPI00313E8A90